MPVCFLCENRTSVRRDVDFGDRAYFLCEKCGLRFVDPLPSAEELYPSYSGGGWKSFRRKLVAPFRRFHHVRHFDASMQRARKIFASVLQARGDESPGRIFDIGCNKGFLLAAAAEKGWEPYGVELIAELPQPFRRQYRLPADRILAGRFADVQHRFPDGFFDAVTAIDVIEHFEAPLEDLKQIRRMLKPGGILLVQTPDADCERARSEGAAWGALKPLEHLFLFNRRNLQMLARRLGFEEIEFLDPFDEADGNLAAVLRAP